VIGSLENEGAVKGIETMPDAPPEAVPIVGAVEAPFVPAPCDPRIGIKSFYPSLFALTIGLADI
jgi:hypothetical protein